MSVAYISVRSRSRVTRSHEAQSVPLNALPTQASAGCWSQPRLLCQVLQSGSGFTVALNNGAPVSKEGNKRFMQLLEESLPIHSVVARYGHRVDAFTVAW